MGIRGARKEEERTDLRATRPADAACQYRVESARREVMTDRDPLFCDRCLCEIHPGRGEFYEVRIEAVADPSPPDLDAESAEEPQAARQSLAELAGAMERYGDWPAAERAALGNDLTPAGIGGQ